MKKILSVLFLLLTKQVLSISLDSHYPVSAVASTANLSNTVTVAGANEGLLCLLQQDNWFAGNPNPPIVNYNGNTLTYIATSGGNFTAWWLRNPTSGSHLFQVTLSASTLKFAYDVCTIISGDSFGNTIGYAFNPIQGNNPVTFTATTGNIVLAGYTQDGSNAAPGASTPNFLLLDNLLFNTIMGIKDSTLAVAYNIAQPATCTWTLDANAVGTSAEFISVEIRPPLTATPTLTATQTFTSTKTATATSSLTRTFTTSPTISPTWTISPTFTQTPTSLRTATATPSFTNSFTPSPTATPTQTPFWIPWPTPVPVLTPWSIWNWWQH